MLATGVSMTAAATIAVAPLPADPPPVAHTAPVVLTGAWQDLEATTSQNLQVLLSLLVNYPPAPILSQIAENVGVYARWLQGQDGGNPALIAKTISQHLVAVGTTVANFALLAPLSFIGPFIAPGVMMAQLIADTAKYPSTPQTVLQAFIDAPANYLNVTLNCCSTSVFSLAFGLINPGPLGYLLQIAPAIATALKITPPAASGTRQPAAAQQSTPAEKPATGKTPAVGQSRRSQLITVPQKSVAARSAKRPAAAAKPAGAAGRDATSGAQGKSARAVKPASPGTR
ncbi:hypothetical protein [Mycobacterium sp. shizuoka-1]|uniref:hypothetical protein n=1 Tax=Mycobacterium sp. shizuoka-1 TaxID=2039281 RepID=UPI000C06DEE9|nr:hypothetical protein [Mycobacterium sp. shizuoka-1]